MPTVRLFASIAQAAGVRSTEVDATTVADLLSVVSQRFGEPFTSQLAHCRVVVDGDTIDLASPVTLDVDAEVAILPPSSGGAR